MAAADQDFVSWFSGGWNFWAVAGGHDEVSGGWFSGEGAARLLKVSEGKLQAESTCTSKQIQHILAEAPRSSDQRAATAPAPHDGFHRTRALPRARACSGLLRTVGRTES